MAITLRTLREADVDAAGAIAADTYRSPGNRRGELLRCLRLQPDGWLLALVDDEPAGLGGVVDYGPFAWIGMMGVHPSMQRRGIARALFERLLSWLDARGCPLAILDASEAGEPLYCQYGFEERDRTLQFRYTEAAPRREVVAHAVTAVGEDELPALAAFDAPIFGASRAAVLASYYVDYPDRVLAARDPQGAFLGYIIARPDQVGPWVAVSPDIARALLAAAMVLPFERPPLMNVPAANRPAQDALLRAGFTPQRSLSHMHFGAGERQGRRDLLYAETSFALG